MSDPNRIIERVEKCLAAAASNLEEAETIADCPDEDEEVHQAAQQLVQNFYMKRLDLAPDFEARRQSGWYWCKIKGQELNKLYVLEWISESPSGLGYWQVYDMVYDDDQIQVMSERLEFKPL
jgi:hypothetical protein